MCREGEELDQPREDAHPRELAGWDAWAVVRRDEAVDAADLRPAPAWADVVEKSAGRGRDVLARRALRRRWELQAAPAAELDAPAPYTRVADRFAEQSCAGLARAEVPALPLEPEAERSQKLLAALLAQEESLQRARPNAPGVRPAAKTGPALIPAEAVLLRVLKPPEPAELGSPELQAVPPPVLLLEERLLWAGSPQREARPQVFLQEEGPPAHDSPADAAQPEPRLPSSG